MPKRTAEDYGLYGLDDATLQAIVGTKGGGEKSRYAAQELAQRRGLMAEANQYRQALERATFQDLGNQYGAGLQGISSYLARSGPLADSGAATALRARLASQLYGNAQKQIGLNYANYLQQAYGDKRRFAYQKALQKQQADAQKQGFWGTLGGLVGGIGGAIVPGLGASSSVSRSSGWANTPWGS